MSNTTDLMLAVAWRKKAIADRTAAQAELKAAVDALRPFREHYMRMERDEDYSYMNERIKDWFGVMDFKAAATFVAAYDAKHGGRERMMEPMLLPPDHPQAPKYWMHETGGKLRPAMERYLRSEPTRPDDVNLIRAYLRQWIDSPVWEDGAEGETRITLSALRRTVREIRSRADIHTWIADTLDLAIDPL